MFMSRDERLQPGRSTATGAGSPREPCRVPPGSLGVSVGAPPSSNTRPSSPQTQRRAALRRGHPAAAAPGGAQPHAGAQWQQEGGASHSKPSFRGCFFGGFRGPHDKVKSHRGPVPERALREPRRGCPFGASATSTATDTPAPCVPRGLLHVPRGRSAVPQPGQADLPSCLPAFPRT